MGLPQGLIDRIMDMLYDDIPALKACSLACKAMLASARHLIYRRLRLILPNDSPGILGNKILLCYAQQLRITPRRYFTPNDLLSHFHNFKFMGQIHTLTIDRYDAVAWANNYKTCFVHFYPTLTSLTLCCPSGHYQLVLQFALQFPNLDNLGIRWLYDEGQLGSALTAPTVVDQCPPLRGNLQLGGPNVAAEFLKVLTYPFPNGASFRSIELWNVPGPLAGRIARRCAHTLENVTLILSLDGTR